MKSTAPITTRKTGGRGWSRFGEAPVFRALTGASLPLVGPAPATPDIRASKNLAKTGIVRIDILRQNLPVAGTASASVQPL